MFRLKLFLLPMSGNSLYVTALVQLILVVIRVFQLFSVEGDPEIFGAFAPVYSGIVVSNVIRVMSATSVKVYGYTFLSVYFNPPFRIPVVEFVKYFLKFFGYLLWVP